MKLQIRTLTKAIALLAVAATIASSNSAALADVPQELPTDKEAINRIELFDSLEDRSPYQRTTPSQIRKQTAQEIRQERALYKADQRMLRHQRNLWMGYEPLRPQFHPVPVMNSRYRRPTIYVPVYIH